MRLSLETNLDPANLNYLAENTYDQTKWNLGKGWLYNAGLTPVDKYATPDFQVIRPMEESVPFAVNQSAAYKIDNRYTYIFGCESSVAAAATRRVHMWTIDKRSGARSWNGFITLTLATATAHTVRDFKLDVKQESTGTVAVSGTAITGTGTQFSTNKVAVGARIGFGSTYPSQITTWYRISAIGSDTGATLALTAGTITAGTPYVIQEFRMIYVATNATTTNGGIHIAKGVTPDDFIPAGTTIPAAVSTDNLKAVYWIKDAATQTDIVAAGCACDFASATPTNLDAYVLDMVAASTYKVYKYNLRAALTVATGASVSAFVLATGNVVFTGTGSQNANCVFATANHGLGSGLPSLYFISTTRMMRATVSGITSGSTTWITDIIAEIPPGGTSTYPLTSALNSIEYVDLIDAFIIGTTGGNICYVTQFVASGAQFSLMFGRDFKLYDQSLKDAGEPSIFSNNATAFSFTNAGGSRIFAVKQGASAAVNQIYVMSFGTDWNFASATSGRLITPEIPLSNVKKFYRVFTNFVDFVGSLSLGKSVEAFRVLARTANIGTDATTGWTMVDATGDLSSFAGASSIQFAIEARTIGETCLPVRILGLNVEYEDNTTDSHYEASFANSNKTTKVFAWRFKTAFGSTVPAMTVTLLNAVTGGSLGTDTTVAHASGTFEKSTDGGATWAAYNTTDKANETTYIRYTPTSLADNIIVSAYLTQT